MRTLILLTAFVATSVLADVEVRVNRIEMSSAAVEEVEETTEKAEDTKAPATDYNSSRSNKRGVQADDSGTPKATPRDAASGLPTGKRQHRDAASGLPTGKRQHRMDTDSDDDSVDEDVEAESKQ